MRTTRPRPVLASPRPARRRSETAEPLATGPAAGADGQRHACRPRRAGSAIALERLRGEQLLQIVRTLDDQMNNTSLILLFEVCGKKLLFPGDAQIENWSYALEDAPDAAKTRALLADVDVYKVGHHGSQRHARRRCSGRTSRSAATSERRLETLLSTMPGKHGKAAKKTEVPRKTLLEALELEDRARRRPRG